MGHVKVGAFDVTIENPKGSERSGTDANGKKWSVKMNNTYGYIRGTEGVDGDHIDVFLAEDMDKWDGKYVFVVDQYNPDGAFDEHKVMLGFNSMEEARSAYLANYEKGWENGRRIDVARIKTDGFQKWVDSSHRKTKPFAHYVIAGAADDAEGKPKNESDRAIPPSTSDKVRMQKAQGYSEFAEKHGVNADDVRAYAEGMALGNVVMANQAFTEIRRTKRIEHRGMKLSEFAKAFKPIKEELYEKFGNVDELNQEYVRRAEEERNMMEAARKKAEEEERKRQAHLDELSLLDDAAIDERYMEALQRGDEATAREMLDEAARRKGYSDTASDYQGVGAWVAPANPGYENDAERRADVEDNAPDVNIEDIALGYSLVDEKYWQEPRKYMQTDATAIESVNAIREAIAAVRRGEKNVKVKVYRAVPTSVKEGKLRNGDWVTPSKDYAKMHGEHRLEGKYRIIEDEVSVNELWWDGNDSREWGFDNGKGYKYIYSKQSLERSEGKPLADIIRSVSTALKNGEFKDNTGLAQRQEVNEQTIREHRVYHGSGVRFFRTSNGEAYGFTVGGKIYIDPRIATAETPIHEYAHLWAIAMREGNPTEWKNIVGLMKGTSVWAEVQKLYPELKSDDDIADEVLATFSGRRGAERLRAEQQKIMQSDGSVFEKAAAVGALSRVKQALSKFWKGVADFLGIHYTSAEEVADRVMKDLLEGVDPRKFGVSGVLRESIRLPKTEYAKVAHAIATNKGFKKAGMNEVFTDNNYYIYTAKKNGDFTVRFGLPIEGNEDVINELSKGVEDGTIRNTRSLYSVIERERSKQNENNYNYVNAEGRQKSTGAIGNLALRQQADSTGSDGYLGEEIPGRTPAGNSDRGTGRETGRIDDNLYRQGEATPHVSTSSESKTQAAQKATENLNLGGRVVVHESAERLEGKEATAKGWYDTKTGQIHVVLSNNADAADVTQTILHEAVAHHGLRELFGHNVMDAFLDSVLAAASQEVKDAINELRRGNGWNFRTATEEYLAGLADRTDFERMTAEERGLFATIRRLFNHALEFLGLKNHELSDRELAYILWCSYQDLQRNYLLCKKS